MRKTLPLLAGLILFGLSILACSSLSAVLPVQTQVPVTPQPLASATVRPTETVPATADQTQPTREPTAPPTTTASPGSSPTPAPARPLPGDYLAAARAHLATLSVEIGARPPGSAAEAQAGAYIVEIFANLGYAPQRQEFTLSGYYANQGRSANIIAVKPGQSAQGLVIGAHYDSGDEALGADDNASGVAVLLAAAEMVSTQETPYTLYFIAFGAEENDLDGSAAYAASLSLAERQNIVAMINLDSLIAGDDLYMYGDRGPGSLHAWILGAAEAAGVELTALDAAMLDEPDGTLCECADYDAFQAAGVPFVFFEATNWDLGDEDGMTQVSLHFGDDGVIRHTRYDTLAYIEDTFPGRVDHHLEAFLTLLLAVLMEFR